MILMLFCLVIIIIGTAICLAASNKSQKHNGEDKTLEEKKFPDEGFDDLEMYMDEDDGPW